MEIPTTAVERVASPVRTAVLECVQHWQSLAGSSLLAGAFFGRVATPRFDKQQHLAGRQTGKPVLGPRDGGWWQFVRRSLFGGDSAGRCPGAGIYS